MTGCALCGRDVTEDEEADPPVVKCAACGTYAIDRATRRVITSEDYPAERRFQLSWACRRHSDIGKPLSLALGTITEIALSVSEPHPPIRKVDELLLFIGRRAPVLNQIVRLQRSRDWPLIFARGPEEFVAIQTTAVNELGYLTLSAEGLGVTPKGWERFAALDSPRASSTTAFVAMAFSADMSPAYDDGFRPTLYDLGFDPIRVDREEYLGRIDDFIVASLRKSALVVADFTRLRSGVFFEAGFALGLGIPVVWTCHVDWLGQLAEHFDTRQYNYLGWKDPADLRTRLRDRIEAAIVTRPRPRA
jgi:hypothetical protein